MPPPQVLDASKHLQSNDAAKLWQQFGGGHEPHRFTMRPTPGGPREGGGLIGQKLEGIILGGGELSSKNHRLTGKRVFVGGDASGRSIACSTQPTTPRWLRELKN